MYDPEPYLAGKDHRSKELGHRDKTKKAEMKVQNHRCSPSASMTQTHHSRRDGYQQGTKLEKETPVYIMAQGLIFVPHSHF